MIAQKMGDHDLEQFDDFMKLIRGKGVALQHNGINHVISEARYVFPNPLGVKANAQWMYDMFY